MKQSPRTFKRISVFMRILGRKSIDVLDLERCGCNGLQKKIVSSICRYFHSCRVDLGSTSDLSLVRNNTKLGRKITKLKVAIFFNCPIIHFKREHKLRKIQNDKATCRELDFKIYILLQSPASSSMFNYNSYFPYSYGTISSSLLPSSIMEII